jgi:hypothetical protein
MKLNLILSAKLYVFLFGLIHLDNVISLLGINENIASAPPYLSFWGWHIVLLLAYLVFPVLTVLVGNYVLYGIVTGLSVVGILVRVLRVFTWVTDFYLILVPVYALAAVLSLVLAVENVASRVSGEILSLKWTQF